MNTHSTFNASFLVDDELNASSKIVVVEGTTEGTSCGVIAIVNPVDVLRLRDCLNKFIEDNHITDDAENE